MNRNRYFCTIKKTHPVNIKSYGNLLKRCIENIWWVFTYSRFNHQRMYSRKRFIENAACEIQVWREIRY